MEPHTFIQTGTRGNTHTGTKRTKKIIEQSARSNYKTTTNVHKKGFFFSFQEKTQKSAKLNRKERVFRVFFVFFCLFAFFQMIALALLLQMMRFLRLCLCAQDAFVFRAILKLVE